MNINFIIQKTQEVDISDNVSGAVLYFVSDLGKWNTAQVAEINGGACFV